LRITGAARVFADLVEREGDRLAAALLGPLARIGVA
jgi:hypothetical protein